MRCKYKERANSQLSWALVWLAFRRQRRVTWFRVSVVSLICLYRKDEQMAAREIAFGEKPAPDTEILTGRKERRNTSTWKK